MSIDPARARTADKVVCTDEQLCALERANGQVAVKEVCAHGTTSLQSKSSHEYLRQYIGNGIWLPSSLAFPVRAFQTALPKCFLSQASGMLPLVTAVWSLALLLEPAWCQIESLGSVDTGPAHFMTDFHAR